MKVVLAFVLGALLVPAVVQARSSSSEVTGNASRQCSALRVEIGPSIFQGAFSSFAACVLKLTPLEQQNTAAADTLCRVRLPAASSSSRLFDRCVMTFTKRASLAEQQSLNPAGACTSLRSSIGTAAFAGKYGSDGNTANAFGNCVSMAVRAQLAVATSSVSTCRAEQEAAGFASAHGGETFARFYATKVADSNAFGRCVSLKGQAQPRTSSQAGQTSTSTPGQQPTLQPSSTTTTTPAPTDETSTGMPGQQPALQPSSTTTSTTASTDACTGGGGKPNRLMPSDCPPASPAAELPKADRKRLGSALRRMALIALAVRCRTARGERVARALASGAGRRLPGRDRRSSTVGAGRVVQASRQFAPIHGLIYQFRFELLCPRSGIFSAFHPCADPKLALCSWSEDQR
jgi:hypothetical protein